jgi:hypothetical protein
VDESLERWRMGWVGTRRIVVASASPVVWPETRSVLEGRGIAIDTATLRDGNGALSADAAAAEVLISGGLALDADVFAQLRHARFVLRPYVGYEAASGGLPERKVILNKDLYDRVAALPECARVTRY